jgi:serine/threonine protein kinase
MAVPGGSIPMSTQSGAAIRPPEMRNEASAAARLPKDVKMASSGGRSSAVVGGEISDGGEQRYEKLASIGSGGMGTVYRARQVALNREVALKEIRDLFGFFSEDQRNEIVRRFTDVVRAWGNLAHPNILPIHDVNLWVEFPYIVTELAPNGSGRRLINDAEEIPVELAFKYLLQTLHALRAAHAQRVYHRGLKPEQLLIDAYGNVKVSDFGFTRIVERDHAVIRQIYVGMGNVAYMAPELYTDPMAAGPQGDIYALGIIFYELLTRKLPGRRSPMPSQINPALPQGIDDIFDRMTRDARGERYATVDDILDDIDKLEGMEAVLGRQNQVLVGESPLSTIKFRPGAEEPLAGTPVEGEEDGDKKSGHRPYSFQQRRKKI